MATVHELRDIIFYILRKLNDVIDYYTREEPPRRIREFNNPHPNLSINERIELLRQQIRDSNREPEEKENTPSQIIDDETENVLEEIRRQNEEYINDLTKQINEKRIILNYLLDELIKLREQGKEEDTIKHLEDEFERLRNEREALEERLVRVKENM